MAKLKSIKDYLDSYLRISAFTDASWNGLQVAASANGLEQEIKKVGVAVDAGLTVFEKAAEQQVDLLIVHHGMFWKGTNPSYIESTKKRIEFLSENKISLYAAHLPLDFHTLVGNNAQLAKILGEGEIVARFGEQDIGVISELGTAIQAEEVSKNYREYFRTENKLFAFAKNVRRLAISSGAISSSMFNEAASLGADMVITGEEKEVTRTAEDMGISLLFLGHHTSETVGVKALANATLEHFPELQANFIDHPTGI
ncbi:MAG: Nif3-like dinuclear metal center hexameric protein [Candidatus Dojkabacteria bacterium]